MICLTCRSAGKENQAGNRDVATILHSSCKGGTHCDCQHKLSGVNWSAVNGDRNDS